jgi:hypothetical protein
VTELFVADGFTAEEIAAVTSGESAATAVAARSSLGCWTSVAAGRPVIVLGRAELVGPDRLVPAVDEDGYWTQDCCIHHVTATGTIGGVALARATGVIGSHTHPRR